MTEHLRHQKIGNRNLRPRGFGRARLSSRSSQGASKGTLQARVWLPISFAQKLPKQHRTGEALRLAERRRGWQLPDTPKRTLEACGIATPCEHRITQEDAAPRKPKKTKPENLESWTCQPITQKTCKTSHVASELPKPLNSPHRSPVCNRHLILHAWGRNRVRASSHELRGSTLRLSSYVPSQFESAKCRVGIRLCLQVESLGFWKLGHRF